MFTNLSLAHLHASVSAIISAVCTESRDGREALHVASEVTAENPTWCCLRLGFPEADLSTKSATSTLYGGVTG